MGACIASQCVNIMEYNEKVKHSNEINDKHSDLKENKHSDLKENKHSNEIDSVLEAANYSDTPHVNYSCIKRGKVIKVTDGDTLVVAVMYYGQLCKFKLRILDINTAELHEKKTDRSQEEDQSLEAKAARLDISKDAKQVMTELVDGKIVDLEIHTGLKYKNKIRFDPYGRLLGKVYLNGLNIGEEMIRRGLAVEYDGGKKSAPKRKTKQ
jgi:endonuclease YncB( thermonuclease family)